MVPTSAKKSGYLSKIHWVHIAPPATTVTIAPNGVPIDIGTMPNVPGFPVTLDGKTAYTDGRGVAHFIGKNKYNLSQRVVLRDAEMPYHGRDAKVSAVRLYGVPNHPILTMDISYQVQFTFENVNGAAIDANEITQLTIKSVTGAVRTVPAHQPVWLQGSRVVPLQGGLDNKDLYWTIQDVQYAGSNVVNASQQKFEPTHVRTFKVELLFYGITVHAHDAFFGFALGNSVTLQYPDGHTRDYRLGPGGRLTLAALPRGNYHITTHGGGPDSTRPLAISRNQLVDLKVYSWLDIVLVAIAGLVFVLGTLLLGIHRRRRHTAELASRRSSTASGKPELPGPEPEDESSHVPPYPRQVGADEQVPR